MYSMIYLTTRGATLIHDRNRALIGIPLYSRQLTYALRRRILGSLHPLTAPSAVHFSKLLFDPALTFPDSLCAHDYFYLRFIGLMD